MKKLGTTYQNKTVTLTCHQRLKLSFTTHLFFTVLTQFSDVLKNRSWTEFSLTYRESNSPRYICRKEDNRQNPQCQNNPDGTSPDQLNVIITRNNPATQSHIPCQQIKQNRIDHIHSNICWKNLALLRRLGLAFWIFQVEVNSFAKVDQLQARLWSEKLWINTGFVIPYNVPE